VGIAMWWFGNSSLGKLWLKLNKVTQKEVKEAKKKGMGGEMVAAFVSTFVISYVLAIFIKYTQATTIMTGIQTGFWLWLGFLATSQLGMVLWYKKPFKVYLIDTFYYLVILAISGAIIAVW